MAACRRHQSDEGLTLVELLIALVVIMVTFAALASTVIAAFSGIRSNEARVRATALANEAIEDMATIPWASLGLSADDTSLVAKVEAFEAGAESDIDSANLDGNEVEFAIVNNELVVLVETSDLAPFQEEPVPSDPPLHEPPPIERDGRFYTLERWVTFVVEDEGADLKRITATVTWEQSGREQRITAESLRAPDPGDLLDLEVTNIVAEVVSTGEARVRIKNDFEPVVSFEVTVDVERLDANLVLTFVDRNDNLQALTAPPIVGGPVERTFVVPQSFKFPHGPVNMLVTATSGDGQVASNTTPMRFYQDVEIDEGSIQVFQDGVETSNIQLNSSCLMAGEVEVVADIAGLTQVESGLADAVLLNYQGDGDATMGFRSTTKAGSIVGVVLTGPEADPSHNDVLRGSGSEVFRIIANRTVDESPGFNYSDNADFFINFESPLDSDGQEVCP